MSQEKQKTTIYKLAFIAFIASALLFSGLLVVGTLLPDSSSSIDNFVRTAVISLLFGISVIVGILSFSVLIFYWVASATGTRPAMVALTMMAFGAIGVGLLVLYSHNKALERQLQSITKDIGVEKDKPEQIPNPVYNAPAPVTSKPAEETKPEKKYIQVDIPTKDEDVLCDAEKTPELVSKIAKYDQNQKRIDDDKKTMERCKDPNNLCYPMDTDDLMKLYNENEILLKEISALMVANCHTL